MPSSVRPRLPPVFPAKQFADFSARLKKETALAQKWSDENKYAVSQPPHVGCELECCLTGECFLPAPQAAAFIRAFADDSATFELAKFNVEFNLPHLPLSGKPFANMEKTMRRYLRRATTVAKAAAGTRVFACGILPTLTPADFIPSMITDKPRYKMLERQLKIMNQDRPFAVDLGYGDGVKFAVNSAAIEAAATSFQVHLEIPEIDSAAFYNAAQAAAAAVLAAGANSPFFMGRKLWAETRVPIFEQILYERFAGKNRHGKRRRRGDIFGLGYLRRSAVGLFTYNYEHMPPLLPLLADSPPEKMRHLEIHNGTIWRWNRPVMGFAGDGRPQLRIEHRPLPSGPTAADMAANMALFVGLTHGLHELFLPQNFKQTAARLPFAVLRDNFYAAAHNGLDATLTWRDGKQLSARKFLIKEMLPLAASGLSSLPALAKDDSARMLDIIRARITKNQNGAQWQIRHALKYGGGTAGMARLAKTYWQNQQSNRPVHEWEV